MTYFLLCLLIFAVGYLINITYITVFYHRGLAHDAVELSPVARWLAIHTGNWITGLDPKGWSVMHRLHHVYSDTPKDPHSPTHYGVFGVALAQLNSYKRVLRGLMKGDPEITAISKDLDFPVNVLNRKRMWLAPYLLHLAIWFAIGIGFDAWMLGYAYFLGIMSHPIQGWMVNSLGHAIGYRNFKTTDDSRNNTLVAWLVMGEGYQNNHHRFPKSAKFSVKWFEIDPGYALCHVLQFVGLIKIPGTLVADDDASGRMVRHA